MVVVTMKKNKMANTKSGIEDVFNSGISRPPLLLNFPILIPSHKVFRFGLRNSLRIQLVYLILLIFGQIFIVHIEILSCCLLTQFIVCLYQLILYRYIALIAGGSVVLQRDNVVSGYRYCSDGSTEILLHQFGQQRIIVSIQYKLFHFILQTYF